MTDEIYIDTVRVRGYSEALREQRRLASELSERLDQIRRLADQEDAWRCAKLCEQARGMEAYLSAMRVTVETVCDQFDRFGCRITDSIEESIYNAKRIL